MGIISTLLTIAVVQTLLGEDSKEKITSLVFVMGGFFLLVFFFIGSVAMALMLGPEIALAFMLVIAGVFFFLGKVL